MTSIPCPLGSEDFDKQRRRPAPPGRYIVGTRPGLHPNTIAYWVRGASRDGSGGEVVSVVLAAPSSHAAERARIRSARTWRETLWERKAEDVQRARDLIATRARIGRISASEAEERLQVVKQNWSTWQADHRERMRYLDFLEAEVTRREADGFLSNRRSD